MELELYYEPRFVEEIDAMDIKEYELSLAESQGILELAKSILFGDVPQAIRNDISIEKQTKCLSLLGKFGGRNYLQVTGNYIFCKRVQIIF